MRTTLLGSLLDAARAQPRPRRRRASPSSSPAASTSRPPTGRNVDPTDDRPIDPLAGEFAGERPAPFHEPHRIGCLAVGPLVPKSWRGGGEPADFFALKGVLEALAGQLGAELSVEPRRPSRSCTPAAPRAIGSAASRRGWIGELHPLVCRAWDLDAAVAFEVDLAALIAAAAAGEEIYEDVTSFPAVYQDLAVVLPAERRGGRRPRGGPRRPAASCCARPRSSTSTRASRSAPGARAWRCGSSSAAADRTLTDEEVAGAAGLDRGEAGGDRRDAPWLTRTDSRSTASPPHGCSSPAPPASPGRSPPSSSGTTRSWSWSPRPRAARPGRGSTASTRATGCRSS